MRPAHRGRDARRTLLANLGEVAKENAGLLPYACALIVLLMPSHTGACRIVFVLTGLCITSI